MKSRWTTCSVPARASRINDGTPAMPMAAIAVSVDGPHTAPAMMASSSAGKASSRSAPRMSTPSKTLPWRIPAAMPNGMPTSAAMATAMTPTPKVMRAPTMSRLKVSRPKRSVPKRCAVLGPWRRAGASASAGGYGVHTSDNKATAATTATMPRPTRPVAGRRR